MSEAHKLPWMKFYPADWRSDAGLRLCSLAARGLWMEMLALMHDADGFLRVRGEAMTMKQLSVLAGCSPDEVSDLLAELSEAGVFSVDENGVIYSRRMRRDIAKAAEDKLNGKRGGNPNLKPKPKDGDKTPVNPPDKAQRLEARCQNPELPADGETREGRDRRLEAECRKIGAELPVVADPSFAPVVILLDAEPSLSEADVLQAMRAVADASHRLKFWSKLEPWIRRAARDRIAGGMKPENYARAGPGGASNVVNPFPTRGPANVHETKSAHAAAASLRKRLFGGEAQSGDQELRTGESAGLRDVTPRLLSQG